MDLVSYLGFGIVFITFDLLSYFQFFKFADKENLAGKVILSGFITGIIQLYILKDISEKTFL